ncbi:MORN repeat-containing protein 5 [Plasmodiophora brassicae]|uniref:MORN repeat-containing protein 5 n=1 Tax=Plasmodiophora brassicae TaxID=37360 RepID=A0A3P3YDW9_PLABS|nr:unnamed protein product [Plasmodiophora brassicae]
MPPKKKDDLQAEVAAEPVIQKGTFTFPNGASYGEPTPILHGATTVLTGRSRLPVGEFIEITKDGPPGPDAAPTKVVTRERHGSGKFVNNGEQFDGGWCHDLMEGTGAVEFATGAKYTGEFKRNRYEGRGKMVWPDRSSYDGDWLDGKMNGNGVYKDPNGQAWIGKFHNDCFQTDTGSWVPASSTLWHHPN